MCIYTNTRVIKVCFVVKRRRSFFMTLSKRLKLKLLINRFNTINEIFRLEISQRVETS